MESKLNQRMVALLGLFNSWQSDPLPAEEEHKLFTVAMWAVNGHAKAVLSPEMRSMYPQLNVLAELGGLPGWSKEEIKESILTSLNAAAKARAAEEESLDKQYASIRGYIAAMKRELPIEKPPAKQAAPEPSLWENNEVQFARVLSELEGLGTLDMAVLEQLAEAMDLSVQDVEELLDRAQYVFEESCAKIKADADEAEQLELNLQHEGVHSLEAECDICKNSAPGGEILTEMPRLSTQTYEQALAIMKKFAEEHPDVVDFMKRAGEVPVVTSISVEGFPVPGSKGEAGAREDLRLWQEAVRKETAEYRKDQAHVELVPLPPMKFMEPSPMPTVPADMSPRHDGVLCYTNENGELVMKSEPMELVTSIGNLSAIKKLELYDDKTKPIVPPDVVSLVASTLENLHYSAGDTILLTQADADAIEDFCGEGVEWAEPKPASPPEPMVSPDHLSARCLAWARLNNPNVTPEQLERMWPGMGDYARRVDGYAETKRPAAADLEVGTYEKEGRCTAATTRGTTSVSAHARGLRSRRAGSAG